LSPIKTTIMTILQITSMIVSLTAIVTKTVNNLKNTHTPAQIIEEVANEIKAAADEIVKDLGEKA
jgi:hypothetical protein